MPSRRFEFSVLTEPTVAFLNKLIDAIRKALPGPLVTALGTLTEDRTVDLAAADLTTVTLGANLTFTLSGATARPGQIAALQLTQDGVGAWTVTLSGASGLSSWTMSATAAKTDLLLFVRTTTTWVGSVHAANY